MRLTRRDALTALAAAGVAAAGVRLAERDAGPLADRDVATLVAAAEVLYPDAVEGVPSFVEQFVRGRAAERPDHARGTARAAAYLDDYARAWEDRGFADLDAADRRVALHRMNADTADPDPDGSDVERVRYYVVNELLFALYASPTGGRLVGIENPPGHPGGLASYQRGGP